MFLVVTPVLEGMGLHFRSEVVGQSQERNSLGGAIVSTLSYI